MMEERAEHAKVMSDGIGRSTVSGSITSRFGHRGTIRYGGLKKSEDGPLPIAGQESLQPCLSILPVFICSALIL